MGYPGETKEPFEELSQFLQDHPLDNVGIFEFSPEEGSPAATLPGQISDRVKGKRQRRLAAIQMKQVEKHNQKMLGQIIPVVVEGRHQSQCPEVDG